MSPRRFGGTAVTVLVLLVVAALGIYLWSAPGGAAGPGSATDALRRHFGLERADVETEETIRAALLRKVPVGSTRDAVAALLAGRSERPEPLVRWSEFKEPEPWFSCSVDYDPRAPGFVKEHYHLSFSLDGSGRLEDVLVTRMLTGL